MSRIPHTCDLLTSKGVRWHYPSFLLTASLICSFLLAGFQFLPISALIPNASAASIATKPPMHKATFTLDGVTVNINTPFIPGKFSISKAGDSTQMAVAEPKDLNVHPFRAIYVIAVPYGTRPTNEGVPKAQAGGAQAYRDFLYQYRMSESDHPQAGPTITLFGQHIQGETSLIVPGASKTDPSTLVMEWVVETGKRLWIIRITEEQTVGITSLAKTQSALSSWSYLTLSSTTLAHSTTINVAHLAITPNAASSAIDQSPTWWHGDTCDSSWFNSQSNNIKPAVQLGASHYHAIIACGPRPVADSVNDECRSFAPGLACVNEWECVELVLRYLYVGYSVAPYPANGNQIVSNYTGTALVKINNGTSGHAPQPGDVLSYNTNASAGHTSLVTASSVNSSGNGTITVLQQNTLGGSPNYGSVETLNVSSWNVTVIGWPATVTGWLHDNGSSSNGTGSGSSVSTSSYNGQQWTAIRESDNHIKITNGQNTYYYSDTTTTTPALTFFKGQVFIAFVPTNTSKNVLIDYGTIGSPNSCPSNNRCHLTQYALTNSSGSKETTSQAPGLSSDSTNLYVTFAGTDSPSHVNYKYTTDGTTAASWVSASHLSGTTSYAPSTTSCNGQQWIAYGGTDTPAHINLATSQANYVLSDTTLAAPVLTCFNSQVFVSFMSSDGNKRVLVDYGALPTGTCTSGSPCHLSQYTLDQSNGSPDTTNQAPALSSDSSNLYLAFTGTDSNSSVNVGVSTDGTTSSSWGFNILGQADLSWMNMPPSTASCNGQQWIAYQDWQGRLNLANGQENFIFSIVTPGVPRLACFNGKVFVTYAPPNPNPDGSASIMILYGAIPTANSCPASNPCNYSNYMLTDTNNVPLETWDGATLSSDGTNLYMAYNDMNGNIYMAQTTDGTTSASWATTSFNATSHEPLGTASCNGQQWLAYETDDHHINLATNQTNYVLSDTISSVIGMTCFQGQIFVDYIDSSGHIFMDYGALPTGSCTVSIPCSYPHYEFTNSNGSLASADVAPELASDDTNLYLAFAGTDANGHINISQTTDGTTATSWTTIVLDNESGRRKGA